MSVIKDEDDGPIKWASMIPLIGGSAIGCKRAAGGPPQFNLSYSAFAKNESHLKKYWPEVPHLTLDDESSNVQLGHQNQELDFVNSVCPCAGLSMLNVSRKGDAARGSDAVQNQWMINSAKFTLGTIRPKVLWGENAPGMFENPGRNLVEKLRLIGEDHGYTFSLVKTNSELHGLPQRRIRTFYFFWKSATVPILEWKRTEAKPLEEYLAEIPSWATLQDVYIHDGKASETFLPYKFVLEKEGLTHAEFSKKVGRTTINRYLEKNLMIEECLNWLKKYYPTEIFDNADNNKKRTFVDAMEHIKNKLSRGLGYWDDSVKFMGDYFSAVISKNIGFAVHPTEDRFFNVRELLHLMGMPHDYQIDSIKNVNHICQNVPVNTAHDWAEEVVKFCRGEAKMSNFTFLKQDNVTQQIVESLPPTLQETMTKRARKRKVSGQNLIKTEKLAKKVLNHRVTQNLKEQIKSELKVELKKETKKEIKDEIKNEIELDSVNLIAKRNIKFLKSLQQKKIKLDDDLKEDIPDEIINIYNYSDDEDEVEIVKEERIEYLCGLCNFKGSKKANLDYHWDQDQCPGLRKPQMTTARCGVCFFSSESLEEMHLHWNTSSQCTSSRRV